MPNVVGLPDIE